jgi:8-oxo-dGTP pyrophosphatase MutT (NUDIX family)
MTITCGIYLYDLHNDKILVCHPTRGSWKSWSIPKGLKEPGEELFQAAARELHEETGINLLQVRVGLAIALPPAPYKKQKKALHSFLVICESDLSAFEPVCSSITPKGYPEVDSWRWIPADQLPEYVHESQTEHLNLLKDRIAEYRKTKHN